jgi:hypothetical protein
MSKEELLLEIAVIRSSGHDAFTRGVFEASIDGHVVTVNRDARSLAQGTRRLAEHHDGVSVVSIITNEAEPKLVAGVSGKFNFRTKS